jgi:hypothetical protein
MDSPEKLATQVTHDEEKENKNTTHNVLHLWEVLLSIFQIPSFRLQMFCLILFSSGHQII